jgi:hypothetical protein
VEQREGATVPNPVRGVNRLAVSAAREV